MLQAEEWGYEVAYWHIPTMCWTPYSPMIQDMRLVETPVDLESANMGPGETPLISTGAWYDLWDAIHVHELGQYVGITLLELCDHARPLENLKHAIALAKQSPIAPEFMLLWSGKQHLLVPHDDGGGGVKGL